MDEDWGLLQSFLPVDWEELGFRHHAFKGLRKDKSPSNLLRVLLIHLACGYSLRETAVRAEKAGLSDLSDVALLKRLRKSKDWLHALCRALFQERGVCGGSPDEVNFRLIDATNVREPGKTGSLWRIHYSIQAPSLECDFFKITATTGSGTGEDFSQFPIHGGEFILADRGYSRVSGIRYATSQGAFVCVRAKPQGLMLSDEKRRAFPVLDRLKELDVAGKVGSWPVLIPGSGEVDIRGRLCAVRKSEEAIALAHKKLKRRAIRKRQKLQPQTLALAQYIILFTTFPEQDFDPIRVLEYYRVRWQIELVFKRFKQIAQLGHLPKHDEESAKAWLYGKLFAALMTEKLIHHAVAISPWGYPLVRKENPKPVA